MGRVGPPLRSQRDRDALSRGLEDGAVDCVCSDHTPVDDDGKHRPFAEAEAGATGLELLLPLTLKWGKRASYRSRRLWLALLRTPRAFSAWAPVPRPVGRPRALG